MLPQLSPMNPQHEDLRWAFHLNLNARAVSGSDCWDEA